MRRGYPVDLWQREMSSRRADDDERAAFFASGLPSRFVRATRHVPVHSGHLFDGGDCRPGHARYRPIGRDNAHGSNQHPDKGEQRKEVRKGWRQLHRFHDCHSKGVSESASRKVVAVPSDQRCSDAIACVAMHRSRASISRRALSPDRLDLLPGRLKELPCSQRRWHTFL